MTKFSVLRLYDKKMWKYSAELPSPVLILQSDWIWLILFVSLDFTLREEGPLLWGGHFLKPPTTAAYRGQWPTSQKLMDLGAVVCLSARKGEQHTILLPIQPQIPHTCKTQGAAVYHPPTSHSSKALRATPENRLCLSTSALLCFHLQGRKGKPRSLPLQVKSSQAFCA